MKPPTFVECSVCGREFGSKSILIHERQCLQKLRRTEITPEDSIPNNSKGTRRKKKTATSNKLDQSPMPTVDDSPNNSKQLSLPKIHSDLTSTRSTEPQTRKGAIRPTTATLIKPKFLNLEHIQYDMSLTRIDYKTSTLKIMSEPEQGQNPSSEGFILPSVSMSSLSGSDKQLKKINTETPNVTKLPQSSLATFSSFFGAPLKKSSTKETTEISLPRQSASCVVLSEPSVQLTSSASFPLLATQFTADSRPTKTTQSTSLLDETILPQILNDRNPDESDLDAFLTSAQSCINLPSAFRDECRRQEDDTEGQQHGSQSPQVSGRNVACDLGPDAVREVDGTEDGEGFSGLGFREGQVGLFDQASHATQISHSELVVLKEPVQFSDLESVASTTDFVFDNLEIKQVADHKLMEARLGSSGSDWLAPDVVPVGIGNSDPGQKLCIHAHEDGISGDSGQTAGMTKRSILKNTESLDKDSSLELTPGYFRVRKKFAAITADDTGDCDDEDEDGSIQYGFPRQVSSLTLLRKPELKPLFAVPADRSRRKRNTSRQHSNHRRSAVLVRESLPQVKADDEAQLVNELTNLLHEELAKPKNRKGRFPRPDTVEEKVTDWLATCQPQPLEDPVSIWEGHANNDASNPQPGRPATSPAALHYHDEVEFGYDTDISRTSSEPSIDDNEEKRKKVISGLLSAVFRIKDLHQSRTYRFEDQMTVEGIMSDTETEDTVHIRQRKRTRLETPIELERPGSAKSKSFGQPLTQKLSSKTLKALERIERNNSKDTRHTKLLTGRPQTAPSQWKPDSTKPTFSAKTSPKMLSSSGNCVPIIIQRPVTSPSPTQGASSFPSLAESPKGVRNSISEKPKTPDPVISSSNHMNTGYLAKPKSPLQHIPKTTPKPKLKRPLTPRPVMKTETMRFLPKTNAAPKTPTKSTTNRGSQIPETRSQCVQSSPTLGHTADWKMRSSVNTKQRASAPKKDVSKSPYTPPKSILKQLPKSKLVQFSLNQDNVTSEKRYKQIHGKTKRPKHNPRPEMKNESFLDYLTQPCFEPNNNKDYHITHQVYQFETESAFGKPVPVSNVEMEEEDEIPAEEREAENMIPSTDSEASNWSPDDNGNFSDDELEGASSRPPEIKQPSKTQDDRTWESLYEMEAQQNADREKDLEKYTRGRKTGKEKPLDREERRYRFKSTYQLLVPKQIEKDKLIDLNIIVRRHDEYSDYPSIEGVVPEFSSDWMYLIVDEVKLTARSPNPYLETQATRKWNHGNALKITTSSHSSIGSGSGEEESKDLSKYRLTCYICGDDFNCHDFLRHESDCRNKFLTRNELLDPKDQEFLPNKPRGTITISTWNRFAQECTKHKRITCQFCGVSFIPTAEKVAEHKAACQPLPRLTPIEILPLVDRSGNEIEVPRNPFLELKLEDSGVNRDLEASIAAQLRKRFNKKRVKEVQWSTAGDTHDENSPPSPSDVQHKRIVVFVEKERDLD